ncbi:MAG: bifunctional methylenetetrahydrofolate dehydrogenase/methenyltetrahydrofolate cyclohydrolase FolD [Candidatus Freyarchaeota archaeon]|nr:bifunctional methylenetetrahydrofolate dehydrogenase/methenyltetrahydrofolate cyclohydrolase FolD [Candidatus Freyrarchaeum guaymaensis]
MGARVIDGRRIAAEIRKQLAEEAKLLWEEHGVRPGLAAILVGSDPASEVYLRIKRKACEEASFEFRKYSLPENVGEEDVIELLQKLNGESSIHGIIVQLPLPPHLDENRIITSIPPEKDVDGLHPVNMGRLLLGDEAITPCTPTGIITLLSKEGISLRGKHVVIINRSKIVGRPLMVMMTNRDATVTVCHSKTVNLTDHTRSADILVVAVGKPMFITEDMVKDGAVVVDVGINRVEGRIVGDVDFERVKEKASAITPVPGGVGPMTVAMLLKNVLDAAKKSLRREA